MCLRSRRSNLIAPKSQPDDQELTTLDMRFFPESLDSAPALSLQSIAWVVSSECEAGRREQHREAQNDYHHHRLHSGSYLLRELQPVLHTARSWRGTEN